MTVGDVKGLVASRIDHLKIGPLTWSVQTRYLRSMVDAGWRRNVLQAVAMTAERQFGHYPHPLAQAEG